jgi:hypothetical protein
VEVELPRAYSPLKGLDALRMGVTAENIFPIVMMVEARGLVVVLWGDVVLGANDSDTRQLETLAFPTSGAPFAS